MPDRKHGFYSELARVTKEMDKLRSKKRWKKWLGADDDAEEITGFKDRINDVIEIIKVRRCVLLVQWVCA